MSSEAPDTPDEKPDGNPGPKPDRHGIGLVGTSIIVFIIGVVVGVPIANFGANALIEYAGQVFGILFGLFLVILLVAALIGLFRKQIWGAIFNRAEIEMDRFARPMADVAKFAAQQRVADATSAARDLAEMVLARYAWVSTRRWLIATITALIAAIAALAGSALLFQQNNLLRTQIDLMAQQNDRVAEQNRFIQAQIELGEAQRSTAIVPEILEIGAQVGQEVASINTYAGDVPSIAMLSPGLRARIVAATTAARPYRYLRNPLADIDENLLMSSGLLRRTDLAAADTVRDQLRAAGNDVELIGEQTGVMSDRPLSPERGQLLAILMFNGLTDISTLVGADFSFAEVTGTATGSKLRLNYASLRFSNFDRQLLVNAQFNGAFLEHARFRNATINQTSFDVGFLGVELIGQKPLPRPAELSGTDFSGAIIKETTFTGARGFGVNFDRAVIHQVKFTNAGMVGSTFRASIFGEVDFTGADLKGVDFDGAIVFDPTFLDTVAAQSAPDGFVRTQFELEPITPEQFAQHPRWANAWLGGAEEKQAYTVKRIAAFQ